MPSQQGLDRHLFDSFLLSDVDEDFGRLTDQLDLSDLFPLPALGSSEQSDSEPQITSQAAAAVFLTQEPLEGLDNAVYAPAASTQGFRTC